MTPGTSACFLVYDSRREEPPLIVRQYAHLRGFDEEPIDLARGEFPLLVAPRPRATLIAASAPTLAALDREQSERLSALVRRGATLYLRGGFPRGREVALDIPVQLRFEVSFAVQADSYRFGDGPLIPAALENESEHGRFEFRCALGLTESAEPLILAHGLDGEHPTCFAIACEAGVVICDLQDDTLPESAVNAPILERLGACALRAREASALIAVERASGRDFKHPMAFAIVLDDRPANFDFFRTGNLERWLQNLESRLPGVHVDFAWVPSQTHPPRSYVAAAGKFNASFVWHGLDRHVDHSEPLDVDAELARGRDHVDEISRRYGVRFQPVMIFPFERHSPLVINAIHRAGFLASFENPFTQPSYELPLPGFLRMSTPMQPLYGRYFPIFRRFAARLLDRGRMLALTALGMPVVATVHPSGVGLGRLPQSMQSDNVETQLDRIVRFAAEKRLRPAPLAAIALESIG
jgi:hypothetical protein